MQNNDLDMVIAEAEDWIERLKALRVKHEAPVRVGGRQIGKSWLRQTTGLPCPNHGNSHCAQCFWPPRFEGAIFDEAGSFTEEAFQSLPTTGFTAVDMTTAAAQGFRDGVASTEKKPSKDCPHAAPFRYCPSCVESPCPVGPGGAVKE